VHPGGAGMRTSAPCSCDEAQRDTRARRSRTQVVQGCAPFQRARNIPERPWGILAGMHPIDHVFCKKGGSPLRRSVRSGGFQSESRTRTLRYASIHGSFLGSLCPRCRSGASLQQSHYSFRHRITARRPRVFAPRSPLLQSDPGCPAAHRRLHRCHSAPE